jgi:hypothetical protein
MGLVFDNAEFGGVLRCFPPVSASDAGGYMLAQSLDNIRMYRFGFDPDKLEYDDGLHFQFSTPGPLIFP